MKSLIVANVLASLAAAPAAAHLYDSGSPVGNAGNETTAWVQAEDFSFASNTTISTTGVYIGGIGGSGIYDGNFQYYIFSKVAGSPGAILASGSAVPTLTDTGVGFTLGGKVNLFTFNFGSAFVAAANTTYYLGIHASAAGSFDRDELYWAGSAVSGVSGQESSNGTFNNWSANGNNHAFFLDGSAVPEPATWALMIGGFAMTGVAMRRRKTLLAA